MRSLRRSDRGLSEIVGTLMLVLIVVTAATLLAAFVATYQAQLQKEQSFAHDQGLESLHILALDTSLNTTGSGFATFGFTVASEYINPSIIIGIALNNEPLLQFNWTNPDNSTSGHTVAGQDLTLPPLEEMVVTTDLDPKDAGFSFVSAPTPNEYLKFDVYTYLQNDFSHVFLPPVPLSVVSQINPSGANPMTLLDGSTSFQPGGNASIVNWGWTITIGNSPSVSTGDSLTGATFTQSGTTVANGALAAGVVDATGATASFTVPAGFVWNGQYLAEFTSATSLAVTGTDLTGTCALSGSSITPGATGTVSGTILTVTFPFTTTISTGCSDATLSFGPPTGVSVAYGATGEEYQVSPALPSPGPYDVTLVVTSSDGLVGSSTSSYIPPA